MVNQLKIKVAFSVFFRKNNYQLVPALPKQYGERHPFFLNSIFFELIWPNNLNLSQFN